MMEQNALSIYLVRDQANSARDDIIKVRRVENDIKVFYYDGRDKNNYDLVLKNTTLGTYVKYVCRLFATDTEPFSVIQFNFKGFPTYMADHRTIQDKNTIDMLVDMSNMVVDAMFAGAGHSYGMGRQDPVKSVCGVCNRGLHNEWMPCTQFKCRAQERMRSTQDDEYADLPDLIPITAHRNDPWDVNHY